MSNSTKPKKIIIKIGTEALSTPTGEPDKQLLESLVAQIAALKEQGHYVALVSSGAVGAGRAFIKNAHQLTATNETTEKQMCAGVGQILLSNTYLQLFLKHGLCAKQQLLTHDNFSGKGLEVLTNLLTDIERNPFLVPIINANDTVAVEELKSFKDNDELSAMVAKQIGATHVILLTNVEGVLDRHPKTPGARLISLIDCADPMPLSLDTSGKSDGGTGGMENKLDVALQLARAGIRVHIACSRTPHVITGIMKGKDIGTHIPPAPKPRIPFTETKASANPIFIAAL